MKIKTGSSSCGIYSSRLRPLELREPRRNEGKYEDYN